MYQYLFQVKSRISPRQQSLIYLMVISLFATHILGQTPFERGAVIFKGGMVYKSSNKELPDRLRNAIENWDEGKEGIEGPIRESTLELTPGIYYLILNNTAIGVSLYYQSMKNHWYWTTGINPGIRRYFQLGKMNMFAAIDYTYAWLTSDDQDFDDDEVSHALKAGIGCSFFLSKNIALEPSIYQRKISWKLPTADEYNTRRDTGINVGIGMYLY
jgi:hypothetical protein